MPDDSDAPAQEDEDSPEDETAGDKPRATSTHTALQALQAMLDPPPNAARDDPPDAPS